METSKKIPIKIKISGRHGNDDETVEEAFGVFSCLGTSMYLIYETKENEDTTIHTMIKMSTDPAEVKKTSTLHKGTLTTSVSSLTYILDETGTGFYTTPYGRLDVKTFTRDMAIIKNDTDITCYLAGRMEINNSPVSEFNLKIEAKAI